MNVDTIINVITAAISFVSLLAAVIVPFVATAKAAGRYEVRVEKTEDEIKEMKSDIKDLSTKMDSFEKRLCHLEGGYATYLRAHSPVSLTKKGEDLLRNSGGGRYIDEHFDSLLAKIKSHHPATAYDVQEWSQRVLRELTDDESFIPLKDFAFEEGKTLDLLISVMAVELRDRALDKLNLRPTRK